MPTQFKDSREECWLARDTYWQCLDSNNDEKEKCIKLRKDYENMCSKQWVKYFDRKRKFDKFKASANPSDWELPRSERKAQ